MSKIEWTEKTWNPIHGCTKVSEACQNCYAEVLNRMLSPEDINGDTLKNRYFTNPMKGATE